MNEMIDNKFVSIVVCTYNGENRIKKCVTSLLNQDYPKSKYEVIVVVDGSRDKTTDILKNMPVAIISHKINRGIAASRNSGLKHVKGDIYVCFDDDCYAKPDWLSELIKSYDMKIAGACGVTKNSTQCIVDTFLASIGHGNPSPVKKSESSIYGRFFRYFYDMYERANHNYTYKGFYEVGEVWGENCSFPTKLLKHIGGWDEKLSGVEDTDLCFRIKKVSDDKFICNPKSVIFHDGKTRFATLLMKPYSRGLSNLRFYLKNNKFPPIFPFPVVLLLTTFYSIYYLGWSGIFTFFVFIYLLYSWWLIKYLRTRSSVYLLFPFIQFMLETSTLIGIFRGVFIMLMQGYI